MALFDDDDLSKQEILELDDFRTAIRISEIESVSFFKIEVFNDFERYKKGEYAEKNRITPKTRVAAFFCAWAILIPILALYRNSARVLNAF